MSQQNINQYVYKKWFITNSKPIFDISLASDERDYNEEVVFSNQLIGVNDGNRLPIHFDLNNSGSSQMMTINYGDYFTGNTLVSLNYYNPNNDDLDCYTASTLCDIGLTGIDNGLTTQISGETLYYTMGLFTGTSKWDRYHYDRRMKLIPVTANTSTPIVLTLESIIEAGSVISQYNLFANDNLVEDLTVNFSNRLGLQNGSSILIVTGVTILQGQNSGTTTVTVNEDFNNLDRTSVISGVTFSSDEGFYLPQITPDIIFASQTPTPSVTPTITPTGSVTPTVTETPTLTPTNTQTPTPSITNTPTETLNPQPSVTPTSTVTPTRTQTPTVTPTRTQTPTISITPSNTPTISITPSITKTPTLTPTPTQTPLVFSADSIYNLLSSSGKTSYQNAVLGNFIQVSESDYVNVLNGLSGATTYGPTFDQFTGTTNSEWGPVSFISDSTQSSLSPNNYIVGFAVRAARYLSGQQFYTVNVYQTSGTVSGGTYTGITNNISFTNPSAGAKTYFIRKSPQTAISSTTYLGLYSSGNITQLDLTTRLQYYSGSPAGTAPFNTLTTRPAAFIVMTTTSKSW
jgi:hypothetical protein